MTLCIQLRVFVYPLFSSVIEAIIFYTRIHKYRLQHSLRRGWEQSLPSGILRTHREEEQHDTMVWVSRLSLLILKNYL